MRNLGKARFSSGFGYLTFAVTFLALNSFSLASLVSPQVIAGWEVPPLPEIRHEKSPSRRVGATSAEVFGF
jgi:hypothetical protein